MQFHVSTSLNIPPYEAEILMSRNQPLEARETEDYRHHTICEWLIAAHRAFEDIGRDVTCHSRPPIHPLCKSYTSSSRPHACVRNYRGEAADDGGLSTT